MSPALLSTLIRSLGRGLFVLPIVPLMLLSFMPRGRQASSPLAYALLALFTVLQGAALGVATWPIPVQLVVRAATASAVAVGGLSAYALTTRRDFTTIGGMLVTAVLGMLSLGLLQLYAQHDHSTRVASVAASNHDQAHRSLSKRAREARRTVQCTT